MQLGMVGLGRMGANMVRRLVRDGHELVVFDVSAEVTAALASETGATAASSLADLVSKLTPPRRSGRWCPPPSPTRRSTSSASWSTPAMS